jgi:hypothetical protein
MHPLKNFFTRTVNKPFFSVFFIFISSILFLFFNSYYSGKIGIGEVTLKKNNLKNYFSNTKSVAKEDTTKKIQTKSETEPKLIKSKKIVKSDSGSQRILLIGDSMLEGFGMRLNDYCVHNDHDMMRIIWYSSNTLWYGSCDTITHFINKFNPTYIILVIGSGDIYIDHVLRDRPPYVQNILNQIEGYPYIWVGPPNWREDTGINELLEKSNPKGTFFLSKNLSFERNDDGIHPTKHSAAIWADSVASFIVNKSIYPIKLDFPEKQTARRMTTLLLSPNPPKLK